MKKGIKLLGLITVLFSFLAIGTVTYAANAAKLSIDGPKKVTVTVGLTSVERYYANINGMVVTKKKEDKIFNKVKDLCSFGYSPEVKEVSEGLQAWFDKDTKLCLFASKPGKMSVTLSYDVQFCDSEGKYTKQEVTKKITVVAKKNNNICVHGYICDYWDRQEAFGIKITNYSSKPFTILDRNIKALYYYDVDGDRTLKPRKSKDLVIKSYESKWIYFKVQGDDLYTTDWAEYVIKCQGKFKGTIYNMRIYPCQTVMDGYGGKIKVKINGKWVQTSK